MEEQPMPIAAFDTLEFTEALTEAGVPDKQAKAEARVIGHAFSRMQEGQASTKEDIHGIKQDIIKIGNKIDTSIKGLDNKIDTSISEVKAEQRLMKWMLGFNLALTASVLFSLLFIPIQTK